MHKHLNLGAFLLLSLTSSSIFTMHNESQYPVETTCQRVTKKSIDISRHRDYGHRTAFVSCTKNLETGEITCTKSYTIAGPLGPEWAGFKQVTKDKFEKLAKELNNSNN